MPEGYVVQCADGPAVGWEYYTVIPPSETIVIGRRAAGWRRMPDGSVPDPESPTHTYRRGDLDSYTDCDMGGAVIISYNVTEDGA